MPPPPTVRRAVAIRQRVDRRAENLRRQLARSSADRDRRVTSTSFTGSPHRRQTASKRPTYDGDDASTITEQNVSFSMYSTDDDHQSAPTVNREPRSPVQESRRPKFQDELLEADTHLDHLATLLTEFNYEPGDSATLKRDGHSNGDARMARAQEGPDVTPTRPPQTTTRSRPRTTSARQLEKQVEALRRQDAENKELMSQTKEFTTKQLKLASSQQHQRQKHIATCLTSLHCLIAELEEIFAVCGVQAPGDGANGAARAPNGEGVVAQLFADIRRLFRALAFGADDTFEDGDCLAAATLLENRRLRALVAAKDHEVQRVQVDSKEFDSIQEVVTQSEATIEDLRAQLQDAQDRGRALEYALAELARQHATDRAALAGVQEREATGEAREHEWQSIVDKTIVEAELMKSHTDDLVTALEKARADTRAAHALAEAKANDIAALTRHNLVLERQLGVVAAELDASRLERKLLMQSTPARPHQAPQRSPDVHPDAAASAVGACAHLARLADTAGTPRGNDVTPARRNPTGGGHARGGTDTHPHRHGTDGGARHRWQTRDSAAPPPREQGLLNSTVDKRASAAANTANHVDTTAYDRVPHTPPDTESTASSWWNVVHEIEVDRQTTQHELSQVDTEIKTLQRSIHELSDVLSTDGDGIYDDTM
eukprot:m.1468409 g.1468409  ORF g.1468409 m.1468409 type:complete len:659 (-) comp25139_c0_seq17:4400-6376(-)